MVSKYRIGVFCILIATCNVLHADFYKKYFTEGSLRIDFIISGSKEDVNASVLRYYHEKFWSGNTNNLILPFDYGTFRIEVFSSKDELIYSTAFSTLFEEWLSTDERVHGPRGFEESVNIPFPKDKIRIDLSMRKQNGLWEAVSRWNLHPENPNIEPNSCKTEAILLKGDGKDHHHSLDFAILTEGYTHEQMDKALNDAERFSEYMLRAKPFDEFTGHINIWLVKSVSDEPGTDDPRHEIWKRTAFSSSFNTLQLDRYLSVFDYFSLKDAAASVSCDLMLVMVNTERYGGGGIYNHFSVFSSDGQVAEKVFLHELGHHLAGLADEYFNAEVSYTEGIDLSVEPWQPNITTLVRFNSKWKSMIVDGVPIPTPRTEKYRNKVGVFEGGIYLSKGAYSPYMDCRMRSNKAGGFCPVCQEAIRKVIRYYIE